MQLIIITTFISLLTIIFILIKVILKLKKSLVQLFNLVCDLDNFYRMEIFNIQDELNFLKDEEKKLLKKQINNKYEGKNILIGDSNLQNLSANRHILLNLGFNVDVVLNGESLLNRINCRYNYDVILTSWEYNDNFNALDLLKKIQKMNNYQTPIVLMISKDDQEKFRNYNFQAFLDLVLTNEQVEQVMDKILK